VGFVLGLQLHAEPEPDQASLFGDFAQGVFGCFARPNSTGGDLRAGLWHPRLFEDQQLPSGSLTNNIGG
jgi:hypothetical protein